MMLSRKDRRRANLKKLAISGTVAAAAGYVAGILTAPKSGKQTRGDIKAVANKGVAEAEKDFNKVHAEFDRLVTEAKKSGKKAGSKAQKELNELVKKSQDAKSKAGEVLSAFRKGKAADKDLEKAVKDAKTALQHLRDYLKK